MTDWQPIETAPKDGTDILVCEPGYVMAIVSWHPVKTKKAARYPGYWANLLGSNWYYPTHWMPLPEQPE